jgi:two-component system alkaline phosphatase synthesis response regulator PhoP
MKSKAPIVEDDPDVADLRPHEAKPKVLIVEDDADFAELLEYNLGKEGCETVRAHNGLQGLNLARLERPDLILLDILLPDMDGMAVCGILRSQPSTRTIPVFVLSALGEGYARNRRSQATFDLFFTKPADMSILGSSIRRAVTARRDVL